ncbi:MAG: NUDIX hydrolase [Clostridia bacterium]|nr:NUDIX hydrolase [Clostridia bacterium]MBR3552649.1 NUDIX hydrolase [Clostridia bacterium]
MDLTEKTLKETTIFDGRIIRVHVDDIELPNGKPAIREIVEHPGGVCVAALTDRNTMTFVRQYRYPYHKVLLELPAGKLEKGEDPLTAGLRELEEECGLQAETVRSLGCVYPTVAYCSEIIYLFLATGLTKTHQHFDEDEFLETVELTLDEAVEMVMRNEITDSKTVAMVLKIARLKETGAL